MYTTNKVTDYTLWIIMSINYDSAKSEHHVDFLIHMYKNIERHCIPLFHDLTLNNSKWFILDDDNKIKYKYSHNHHKGNG